MAEEAEVEVREGEVVVGEEVETLEVEEAPEEAEDEVRLISVMLAPFAHSLPLVPLYLQP